jgi:hypothetical protein
MHIEKFSLCYSLAVHMKTYSHSGICTIIQDKRYPTRSEMSFEASSDFTSEDERATVEGNAFENVWYTELPPQRLRVRLSLSSLREDGSMKSISQGDHLSITGTPMILTMASQGPLVSLGSGGKKNSRSPSQHSHVSRDLLYKCVTICHMVLLQMPAMAQLKPLTN